MGPWDRCHPDPGVRAVFLAVGARAGIRTLAKRTWGFQFWAVPPSLVAHGFDRLGIVSALCSTSGLLCFRAASATIAVV